MEQNKIIQLKEVEPQDIPPKDYKEYIYMRRLVEELNKRDLPQGVVEFINDNLELINHAIENKYELKKQIKTSKKNILRFLEKQLKIVTKNHYRNLWMALGMTVFGVPMGIVWGQVTDNMGSLGIGIAIGMTIGLALGNSMDKKAAGEGRQLNIEANS
ncbi:hypothetical protein [Carboxylicivirga sp. RSCT41]|uniref:hypothetical protein n=1 Tax=Carboxylicivirga agarovorans TaxID=3417570 RepID=UPI003D33B0E6